MVKLFIVMLITNFFCFQTYAQYSETDLQRLLTTPLQYTVFKTSEEIVIDGKSDEQAWAQAPWTPVFSDISTGQAPDEKHRARCKMLWGDNFLYVYAELTEPDIWASITKTDSPVFQDNALEMFISPGGGTYDYVEFQINAFGTTWDLFLPKPYRNGGAGLTSWDIKGLQKAVHLNGTINNPLDKDKGWSLELAVPFRSVVMNGSKNPSNGTIWRMNFSRVQWQLDTLTEKYYRRKNEQGRVVSEQYYVWSPQGIINLHMPERWGYVLFSDSVSNKNFLSEADEKLKLEAWKYYYLQQQFKSKNGKYASRIKRLDRLLKKEAGAKNQKSGVKMYADDKQFLLEIFLPFSKEMMILNDEGEVHFDRK
jgi:hypothetical protein